MPAVRNEETLADLVDALERNAGDIANACSLIGASTGWLKKWMRDDAKVEAAINDAKDTGTTVIESAAIKRAVNGVEEPIYYKDELVGYRRRYSDALTIKLLEARRPEVYGKKLEMTQNINVKQLDDKELDKRIAMLSERLGMAALPSPDSVEDAEFSELVDVEDLL